MIPQHFIEEVQQRTDIVDLISGYIPLRKTGRNFKALCPFHNEKTPSFLVSPQKQIFHCFGCAQGGGSLQFLMLYDKLNFVEAVEVLAKRLGMNIPHQRGSGQEKLRSLLYEALQEASLFFYNTLCSQQEGQRALEYLQKRGIKRETIDTFKIGFAPGRNKLLTYLRNKEFTLEILEKASLVIARRDGGYLDLFRERITFPIFDVRNRVVGFGARTIQQREDIPKYINSLENTLYKKREHLYGLSFSKNEVTTQDAAIVTEGYLDMIVPYSEGVKNVVASLGTALTFEQIKLIRRYTRNIILVFDADKAGQNATLRALDTLLENGLGVKVLTMPQGFDPDSMVRTKGREYFLSLLEGKVNFFDYKMGVLKRQYDIDTIEGKTKIAHHMLTTIGKLGSEVEKYEYIKKLASSISAREEVLIAEMRKIDQKPMAPVHTLTKSAESVPMAEKLVLKCIFANAKVLDVVKKKLRKDDFFHPLTKKTYSLLVDNFCTQHNFSLSKLMSTATDGTVSNFISQVLIEDVGILNKDVLRDCIVKLKSKRVRIMKETLRQKLREAEKSNDAKRVKELILQYRKISSEVRNG